MTKKILSVVISIVMCLFILPMNVLADEGRSGDGVLDSGNMILYQVYVEECTGGEIQLAEPEVTEYAAGTNVYFEAIPEDGYRFVSLEAVEIDPETEISEDEALGFYFVMPEKDETISAEFEKIEDNEDQGIEKNEDPEVTVTKTPTIKETEFITNGETAVSLVNPGEVTGGWFEYQYQYERGSISETSQYTRGELKVSERGKYTVTYRIVPDGNHKATGTNADVVTLAAQTVKHKAVPMVPSPVQGLQYKYSNVEKKGVEQVLITEGKECDLIGGTMRYSLDGGATWESDVTQICKVEPGGYNVKYKVAANTDDYYVDSDVSEVRATIDKRPVKVFMPVANKEYDGTTVVDCTVDYETDNAELQLNIQGSTESADVTDTALTLEVGSPLSDNIKISNDEDKLRYTLDFGSFQKVLVNIEPRKAEIEWDGVTAFNYDGNPHVPTASVGNLVDGDTCVVTVAGEQVNANAISGELIPGKEAYAATAVELDNKNYKLSIDPDANSTKFVINKVAGTITKAPQAIPYLGYTGNYQELVTAGESDDGTFLYTLGASEDFSADIPKAKDIGSYYVYWKFKGDDNHLDNDTPISIKVKIAEGNVTIKKAPTAVDILFYSGEEQTLVNDGEVEHGTIYYYLGDSYPDSEKWSPDKPTAAAVGGYKVWWYVKGDQNYRDMIPDEPIYVDIVQATPVVTKEPTTKAGLVYNSEEQALIEAGAVVTGNGQTLYSLEKDGTYTEEVPKAKNAGEYEIWWYVNSTENYIRSKKFSVKGEIAPVTAELLWENTIQTYTGAELMPTATVANLFSGDDCTVKVSCDKVCKNVGEYTVTASLEGSDAGNYTLTQPTVTASITAKNVSEVRSTPDTQSVVYGGGSFNPPKFHDDALDCDIPGTLTYTYNDQLMSADAIKTSLAALSKGATGIISYSYAASGNYTGTITGKIEYTIVDLSFKVNGYTAASENAVDIKANPVYGDTWADIITIKSNDIEASVGGTTGSGSYFLNVSGKPSAGDQPYSVLFSGSIGGYSYTDVTVLSGTVDVTKAALTITAKNQSVYIGGTVPDLATLGTNAYTVTGLVNGDSLTTAPAAVYAETPDMTIAGSIAINISGADAGPNYTIAYVNGTLTISKRPASTGDTTGGGGSSSSTVTVPVSGEGNTVNVSASVKGNTAAVDDIKAEELAKVADGESVSIDLSGVGKNVSAANIPTGTVEKISEKSSLTVKLPSASVAFDAKATKEIVDQAKGNSIDVVIDSIKEVSLNAVQKEAAKKLDTAIIIDIHLASNGGRLCTAENGGFDGGKATIVLPYEIKNNRKAANYSVFYVNDAGKLEKLNAKYDKELKAFVFEIEHFSVYAVAFEQFVDIDVNAYYYDAVKWAAANGITDGTDSTHFSPNGITNRGQMVTFLWRAAGKPEPTLTECPFTDVKAGSYYYKAVLWAYEKGITDGTTATTFEPDKNVSRAQTVTFLWRYAGKPVLDYWMQMTDVASGKYYTEAVRWALAEGITEGTSKTTFSPNDDCLRGQIVTFLYRSIVK